jgi:hypothetical protein
MSTVNRICLATLLSTSFHITYFHSRDITSYSKPEHYTESFRRVSGYRYDIFNIYFSLLKFINPMYPDDGSSKLIQNVSNYLPFNTMSIPEKLSHLHQYCCENLKSQIL